MYFHNTIFSILSLFKTLNLISISTQRNNVLKLIKDKETKTERGNKYLSVAVNLIFMS